MWNVLPGRECGSIFIDKEFFKWLEKILEPWDSDPRDLGNGGHMIVKPQGRYLLQAFQTIKHRYGDPSQTGDTSALPLLDSLAVKQTEFARSKVDSKVLQIHEYVIDPTRYHETTELTAFTSQIRAACYVQAMCKQGLGTSPRPSYDS